MCDSNNHSLTPCDDRQKGLPILLLCWASCHRALFTALDNMVRNGSSALDGAVSSAREILQFAHRLPQIRFVFYFTAQTAVKRRAFVRVPSASTAATRRELKFLGSSQVTCYVLVLARAGYCWSPVAFCICRRDVCPQIVIFCVSRCKTCICPL